MCDARHVTIMVPDDRTGREHWNAATRCTSLTIGVASGQYWLTARGELNKRYGVVAVCVEAPNSWKQCNAACRSVLKHNRC